MKEKEKTSNKKCYGCGSYDCYYTKGYVRFNREKLGYCNKQKKVNPNQGNCEEWERKSIPYPQIKRSFG